MPAPATTTLLRVTCPAPLPPSAGPGGEATLGVCASGAGELDGGELVGGSSLGGAEVGEGDDAGGTKMEGDGAGELVTGGGEGGGVGVGSTGAGAGVAGVGVEVGLPAGAGVGDCATAVTAKMASKRREEAQDVEEAMAG